MGRNKLNLSEEERLNRKKEQKRKAQKKYSEKLKQIALNNEISFIKTDRSKLDLSEEERVNRIKEQRRRAQRRYLEKLKQNAPKSENSFIKPGRKKLNLSDEERKCRLREQKRKYFEKFKKSRHWVRDKSTRSRNKSNENNKVKREISDDGILDKYNSIIKCGEVQIIKNVWKLQFICSECGEILEDLQQFLVHSLHHNLDATEDDFNSIIEQITEEKQTRSTSVTETYFVSDIVPDLNKVKQEFVAEDYQMSEINTEIDYPRENPVPDESIAEENIQKDRNSSVNKVQITEENQAGSTSVTETCFVSDIVPDLNKVKQEFVAEDYQMSEVNTEIHYPRENPIPDESIAEENIRKNLNPSGNKIQEYVVCASQSSTYGLNTSNYLEFGVNDKTVLVKKETDISSEALTKQEQLDFSADELTNYHFENTIRPYNCSLCDEGFALNIELKNHLKLHEANSTNVEGDHRKRRKETIPASKF